MRHAVASVVTVTVTLVIAVPGGSPSAAGPDTTRFVSPNGFPNAPCTRSAPCATLDRAYRLATPGGVVEIAGGTYPAQVIGVDSRKLRASRDIVFRPAPGAVVVVNGDLTMYGSHAVFRGGRRPDGTYTLQARRLRSEMRSLGTASRHVVFENVKAATFLITGPRFITIRGGDFGPNVACWPRGRTGAGDYGAPIAPETWCPEGSGYKETGNAADFQAKIGPNGAVLRSWPHDIVLDGITVHDQNSLDIVNLHNGGIFLVSGYRLTIVNSRFSGNIVYDLFASDFTTPECCGMSYGPFREVVLRNNWFGAPVDAALQPGGNGWTSRVKNDLPEIRLRPQRGKPWRNWLIERNSFENGILLGAGEKPTFENVRVRRNVGGGAECYPGEDGLTWRNNVMATGGMCRDLPVSYGYALRRGRLVAAEPAAGVVRTIFRAAAGGSPPTAIAVKLRRTGAPVPGHGTTWTAESVRQVLGTAFYLGRFVGPPGAHPALVGRATWRAAQRALRGG